MKRILLTILAIILCLAAFSGCANNKYKGPLSCISRIGADGVTALMDMTEDAHKTILSVLNKGKWKNDVTNCGYDYEFTTKNETIRYHSECGTFIDVTNGQAMVLAEKDKDIINDLLGASNTNTDNISGKRLPIVMTIAETLPSCVAFEYKDGNPYCFYAYDDDGKLYRVLWNNFDGLNEKDRIVVDHNDNIIALNYDEYPSGWTPQYEITAISIYSEEEWNAFEQNGANKN